MSICPFCPFSASCKRGVRLVSDKELSSGEFVRDVRNFAADLGERPAEWLDYVLELLALLDGCIVDGRGQPAYLSTEIFLPTDQEIDDGVGAVIEYRMRNWFEETFATPVPESVTPHVRIEAKERFRIVATILRARFPAQAAMWGVRAANDNFAPIPPTEQAASA